MLSTATAEGGGWPLLRALVDTGVPEVLAGETGLAP